MDNRKGISFTCALLAQSCYLDTPKRGCKRRLDFDGTSLASTEKRNKNLLESNARDANESSERVNLDEKYLGSEEQQELNLHCGQNKDDIESTPEDKCVIHENVPSLGHQRDNEQDDQKVILTASPLPRQDVGSVSEQISINARKDVVMSLQKEVEEEKPQINCEVLEPRTPFPPRQKCPSSSKSLSTNKISLKTATKSQQDNELKSIERRAAKAHYYTRLLNQVVLNHIESLEGQGVSKQLRKHTGQRRNSTGHWKIRGSGIILNLKGQQSQSKKLQSVHIAGKKASRAWRKLLKSAQSPSMKSDEDEGISLEDESQLFRFRGLMFNYNVRTIQGPRVYVPWKGSVLDSVMGAFLTQRVSDNFSSSAFMSLGARFPQNLACSVYSKNHRILREKRSYASDLNDKLVKQSRIRFDEKAKKSPSKARSSLRSSSSPDWNIVRREYSWDEKRERSLDTVDYVDWDAVRRADVEDISKAISLRGMNKKLAKRIKDLLDRLLLDHRNLDLEWVRNVPPQKAREFLLGIMGFGMKSGECVRLLTLKQPAFPVDVNVARVTVRLGWVPAPQISDDLKMHLLKKDSTLHDLIHQYLWPRLCKLNQETLYELHYQMITFGKVFCTKKKPNCGACPMRNECKYHVSTVKRKKVAKTHSTKGSVAIPASHKQKASVVDTTMPSLRTRCQSKTCTQSDSKIDIEDLCHTKPVEPPQTPAKDPPSLKPICQNKTHKTAASTARSRPNKSGTRTEHTVYELPDWHPILETFEDRDPDDPSPYLLVTWEPAEGECDFQKQSQMVPGTIMLPCRTALKGKFPLNGTYFQTNEVFADHETSQTPIEVCCKTLQNIPKKRLYCGANLSTIVKGLSADEIRSLFNEGYICTRGFDRESSTPKTLKARFHRSSQVKK